MSNLKIDRNELKVLKRDFNCMVEAINDGLNSDSLMSVFDSYNFTRAMVDFARFLGKNKEMFIRTGALMNKIDGKGYDRLVEYGLKHPLLVSEDEDCDEDVDTKVDNHLDALIELLKRARNEQ